MTFLIIVLAAALAVYLFMNQPKFGKKASGARLERMRKSFHYDKEFQNPVPTPNLKEGVSMLAVFYKFFTGQGKRHKPSQPLPSVKENLHNLLPDEDIIVWFGHSSYFMQIDGRRFLVDPVFSGAASPLSFTTRSFPGSDLYSAADMPDIDYLIISHDHWDHLDYATVKALRTKVKHVITGLGTGATLASWGYDEAIIIENDWWQATDLGGGFVMTHTPARHFSGRGFVRNRNLWTSFVLQTPSKKIFLGGDSGYGPHFEEIGAKYGPFDVAVLECGQYNEDWPYIHMLPNEWALAMRDLNAKSLLPVHWGKFALSLHDWDAPIRALLSQQNQDFEIWTPRIGEKVNWKNDNMFEKWWEEVS